MTRVVCLSDTHNRLDRIRVPDGDLLIHAGDMTSRGTADEIRKFAAAFRDLPHAEKIVVAGNHDFLFERDPPAARAILAGIPGLRYLEDSAVEVCGLLVWGSPWQPEFMNWAFNLPRGRKLREKWARIPERADIVVTHGPPHGVLDATSDGRRVGCEELALAIGRVRPRLHVFGHIHEAYGRMERDGTVFVNASNCDLRYRASQPPVVVDL